MLLKLSLTFCSVLLITALSNAAAEAPKGPALETTRANVPVIMQGDTWIATIPASLEGPVEIRFVEEPARVFQTASKKEIPFQYDKGTLRIDCAKASGEVTQDVQLGIQWEDTRWKKSMAQFAKRDQKSPPEKDCYLFVGSSSIRMWDLKKCFPDLPTINNGFGGSQYKDALFYADQLFYGYTPKAIVLYDGDNDISAGKSPEWVFADFKAVHAAIRWAFPETPVIVLPAKHSKSREKLWPKMKAFNDLVAQFADARPHTHWIDTATALEDEQGQLSDSYFLKDKLHLSDAGYAIWSRMVRTELDRVAP